MKKPSHAIGENYKIKSEVWERKKICRMMNPHCLFDNGIFCFEILIYYNRVSFMKTDYYAATRSTLLKIFKLVGPLRKATTFLSSCTFSAIKECSSITKLCNSQSRGP